MLKLQPDYDKLSKTTRRRPPRPDATKRKSGGNCLGFYVKESLTCKFLYVDVTQDEDSPGSQLQNKWQRVWLKVLDRQQRLQNARDLAKQVAFPFFFFLVTRHVVNSRVGFHSLPTGCCYLPQWLNRAEFSGLNPFRTRYVEPWPYFRMYAWFGHENLVTYHIPILRAVSVTFVVGLGEGKYNVKRAKKSETFVNLLMEMAYFHYYYEYSARVKVEKFDYFEPKLDPHPKNLTRFRSQISTSVRATQNWLLHSFHVVAILYWFVVFNYPFHCVTASQHGWFLVWKMEIALHEMDAS